MKRTALCLSLVGLLGLAISCGGGKTDNANLLPLEDFFKKPEKVSYQLSPDGKYFAYMAPVNSRLNIFVQEIGKAEETQLTNETERDVAGFFWGNNSRILFLKDSGGDENYKLFGVDIDGNNPKGLTDFDKVRTQIIDDLPEIEEEIIIGMNKRNAQVFDPYRLNIVTGELTMLAENPGNIQGWGTDHDGKLRLAYAIVDGINTSVLYRDNEKAPFTPLVTTTFKDQFGVALFTFDNKNLYVSSNIGRDKAAIYEYDVKAKKETSLIYENPDYDVTGLGYSPLRKVITAAYYTSWRSEREIFDDETKQLYDKLQSRLGDYEVGITSRSKDETKYIVHAGSDRSYGAYYFYDKATDSLQKIADISPWLDENKMCPMTPIQYTSRDGLTINGYLTLPLGYTMETAKDLPVVVNPHGGPWARDEWGFNPEVQFLANRGYAVLQMNFRGSTGYGKKFWEASFKEWGKTMQDDITDGVSWLVEKGIADKSRIAIYGGSYGGYATLAGITFTPDLYACAVDYVGVSNLFTFLNTIPPYWKPMLDMMYEMVGDPKKDSTLLASASPVFHVDKIKSPLFVAQGANDPRVNKDESDQMVEALKKRGVEVEYMVKDNEGHGFHNEENQFAFYRAMESFLAKYMQKK